MARLTRSDLMRPWRTRLLIRSALVEPEERQAIIEKGCWMVGWLGRVRELKMVRRRNAVAMVRMKAWTR